MKIFYKKLGERIKSLREKSSQPQEKLAKVIGISRVSLSQIENGERRITAEEIVKLANIFNINADILLDLKSDIEVIV